MERLRHQTILGCILLIPKGLWGLIGAFLGANSPDLALLESFRHCFHDGACVCLHISQGNGVLGVEIGESLGYGVLTVRRSPVVLKSYGIVHLGVEIFHGSILK